MSILALITFLILDLVFITSLVRMCNSIRVDALCTSSKIHKDIDGDGCECISYHNNYKFTLNNIEYTGDSITDTKRTQDKIYIIRVAKSDIHKGNKYISVIEDEKTVLSRILLIIACSTAIIISMLNIIKDWGA